MNDASLLDPLTGALTRATFHEHLRASVERARRENSACSLLLFDLDHFKSINDAFGHARGDEALIQVARCVRQIVRDTDLFFRYGGDEFVVIAPDTTKAQATELGNRLLESIRAKPLGKDGALRLSISVGVATFPEDITDENVLFEKADARNYEAKRRGRARVVFDETSATPELPFAELSRIIERDNVLETAQNFLNALAKEQRGVLCIVGEQGAGRSRVLLDVEKRARLQGFEILALRGSPRLKDKPHGVLASAWSQFSNTPLERFTLEELDTALHHQLGALGRARVLLCVDDMPEVDWGTLDLVRQLVARSSLPILGLVYATDPVHARVDAPFDISLSERATLQPLSANGLQIWLRVLMQWEPPAEFITWLEQETRGMPHDVERLIKHLTKQGALTRQGSEWILAENYASIGVAGMRQWQKRVIPNNLPSALTSFVGRETELAQVRELLGTTRLLTIVGTGGLGKTRLTLQAAKESLYSFPDGVWLIELAPVSEPSLALYTIASVLGVREEQARPLLETLCAWLSNKELLLVLDNCEHLIETCAQFAHNVLTASPNVRILASSREALDIAGEMVYRMPALETPDPQKKFSVGELMQFESARLFLERASFAVSNFNLRADETPLVAQICRQLDGIPLALELAAARLKALSLQEIADGLNDRFSLLSRGNRAALPRQQTLRALVDWSYDLLAESERVLLQRLAIFAGGWTLEAANAVCGQAESENISKLLQLLADKSLIHFDERAARFSMLETIRQYAHEKLVATQQEKSLRDLHTDFYLQFTEQTEAHLIRAQRGEWTPRVEAEHDNLRAALEHSCTQNADRARRMIGALGWFWYFADHLNEGHAWCLRAFATDEHAASEFSRARAFNAAGIVSGNLGYNDESRAWLEQSAALWQILNAPREFTETLFWLSYALVQLGQDERVCELYAQHQTTLREYADPLILGWALAYWARALENARGDFATAKSLYDEAVALGLADGDINILGTAYMNLGYWAAKQGDYEKGYQYHLESSKWHKTDGARLRIAISSHNMADMLCMQRKFQEAQALYEESLALSRALGDQAFIAWTAYRLGYVQVYLQEYARARDLFGESIQLYRAQTEQEYITSALAGCAELQRAQGELKQAARTLGFVAAHPQATQRTFLLEIDSVEYRRTCEILRAQMDKAEFDCAWHEGQAETMDKIMEQAVKR